MTFKRLLDSSGTLTDQQLERLITIALQDEAVLAAGRQLAEQARDARTEDAPRDRGPSDALWQQARWLSLREYPQSEVNDWNELNRQLNAHLAMHRVSDPSPSSPTGSAFQEPSPS